MGKSDFVSGPRNVLAERTFIGSVRTFQSKGVAIIYFYFQRTPFLLLYPNQQSDNTEEIHNNNNLVIGSQFIVCESVDLAILYCSKQKIVFRYSIVLFLDAITLRLIL